MTFTRPSCTWSITLEDVIDRLRQRDEIDGVMVVGSADRGQVGPTSDYDLFILMSSTPVPIERGQTYVDGRITDLKFMMIEEMDKLIAAEEPVSPYTGHGRAFLRMGDGKIELDRSGRLGRAQERVLAGVPVQLLSEQENHLQWMWMNGGLRLSGRLVASDDPEVVEAAEIMMSWHLNDLMTNYFNFGDLMFKGEKEAVKYWASNDAAYHRAYMECLREPDPRRKQVLLGELSVLTAEPRGGLWNEGETVMHLELEGVSESDIAGATEKAFEFWDRLIAEPDG